MPLHTLILTLGMQNMLSSPSPGAFHSTKLALFLGYLTQMYVKCLLPSQSLYKTPNFLKIPFGTGFAVNHDIDDVEDTIVADRCKIIELCFFH